MISASATEHFVKSPEDLKSKNVAVLCGTSTEQWVKANNVARTVVCAQTMVDAVDLVKKELVDAVRFCFLISVSISDAKLFVFRRHSAGRTSYTTMHHTIARWKCRLSRCMQRSSLFQ